MKGLEKDMNGQSDFLFLLPSQGERHRDILESGFLFKQVEVLIDKTAFKIAVVLFFLV